MRLLLVQAAALGHSLCSRLAKADFWGSLGVRSVEAPFPALTCTAQASLRTGLGVPGHGVVANGYFDRTLRKALFWEQSSRLCEGPRIWDSFRASGGKVAQLCLQQSLGDSCDIILSPAPVHKHHGGMIQSFHSKPEGFYEELCGQMGSSFNLMSYWGPFASAKSSEWIAGAAAGTMRKLGSGSALVLCYLPHLDYDLQRFGPESPQAAKAFQKLEAILSGLLASAKANGFSTMLLGDYEIESVSKAAFPNRALREAGLFRTRTVKGMLYPDLHSSSAFALADHQVAHVYAEPGESLSKLKSLLSGMEGVARVIERPGSEIDHPRSGELLLEAASGFWFAYPWWGKPSEAPDYATHVDIHNKPGYDPCELFLSLWPPFSVSCDASKPRGSHGRAGGCVALGSDFTLEGGLFSFLDCPALLRSILRT